MEYRFAKKNGNSYKLSTKWFVKMEDLLNYKQRRFIFEWDMVAIHNPDINYTGYVTFEECIRISKLEDL